MEKPTLRQLVPPVSPDRRPPDTHTTSKGVTVVNLTPKSPVPGKATNDFAARRQNFRRGIRRRRHVSPHLSRCIFQFGASQKYGSENWVWCVGAYTAAAAACHPRRRPRSIVLAHLTASPPPILHGSAITLTQFLLSRRAIPRVNQRLRNVLISACICRGISAGRKSNLLPLRTHGSLPIHFKDHVFSLNDI